MNKGRAVFRAVALAEAGTGRSHLCDGKEELIMLLMIDNYDSFTYNLVQYFGELGADVRVVPQRRDRRRRHRRAASPSSSSSHPVRARPTRRGFRCGRSRRSPGKLPILGVCLGHQTIGQAFGGRIVHAREVMHGKTSPIRSRDRSACSPVCPIRSRRRVTIRW